jgi:hypothetical protein
MDRIGDHHAKQNKPVSQIKVLHVFSHVESRFKKKPKNVEGELLGKQMGVERG